MSLRSKIALVLFAAVAAFTGIDHYLYRLNFETRFRKLDQKDAEATASGIQGDLQGVLQALDRAGAQAVDGLGMTLDEGGQSPPDWDQRLQAELDSAIEVVLAFDAEGRVRLRQLMDPAGGGAIDMREIPNEQLDRFHPLRRSASSAGPRGVWMTEYGALLVAAPATWKDGDDELRLVLGRFLDAELLAEWGQKRGVVIEPLLAGGNQLSEAEYAMIYGGPWESASILDSSNKDRIRAWTRIDDLGGSPAMLLRTDVPPRHSLLWSELRQYDLASTIAVAILFPWVILLLLQWVVTGPLAKLTSHATWVSRADDPSLRLGLERTDEIGVLASEFDTMLGKLADSREEVVRTARMAGMTEISVGVMHNVGNVLTSLSTSASMTRQHLEDLSVAEDLRSVREALESNIGQLDTYLAQDSRGSHLMSFLSAIIQELEDKTQLAAGEMGQLYEGVAHMEALLCSLSQRTAPVDVVEVVDVPALLDSVIELCLQNTDDGEIAVERIYADLPSALVDRHKLMEVLMHLVQNALEATEDRSSGKRQLCAVVGVLGDNLSIKVEDNGCGIAADCLEQVFQMGFSTRKDGRGFGLHFAATAAAELGGSVSASSPGPGKGAVLQVQLPLRVPDSGRVGAA